MEWRGGLELSPSVIAYKSLLVGIFWTTLGSTPTTTTNRLVVEILRYVLIEYNGQCDNNHKKGVVSTSVSNDVLHYHGVLCTNDLVVVDNDLIGIIVNQHNNNFSVKDMTGKMSVYSRERLRLATTEEITEAFRQLISSL